jgi:hypothetical protein
MQTHYSTDIRIGVLLHEAYQPSGPPTVKPITTMPQKIYGTPRSQRPRFAQDETLIPQLAQGSVSNPVKVILLVLYF